MDLVIIAFIPFILALAAALAVVRLGRWIAAWGFAAVAAGMFAYLAAYVPIVSQGGPVDVNLAWASQIGLTFSIYLDGLALIFALIVTGVGAVVLLFTGYYFEGDAEAARFFWQILAFMGAMLNVVLSGNLLVLFIAWELTSITSFLLIGFKGSKDAEARRGAMQALIITAGGGLALLAGLLLLGSAAGSFEMREVLARGDVIKAHPWYTAILALVLVGAFTKSAQFPFHFWLPGAMAAPTPASAYLHSATMVKAGVYLLARLYPALGDTPVWRDALMVFGLTTLLLGSLLALRHTDLKALLAYSTVSMLGAFVALIGLPGGAGLKAAYVGILAHAMYKGTLFLIAGTVDHALGTRDLRRLGGLARQMPVLAGLAIIVGLSMAGVPPLLGFVAKETLLEAALAGPAGLLVTTITVIAAILTVMIALIFVIEVFFGRAREDHHHVHLPPAPLLIGPGLLALLSVAAGVALPALIKPLVMTAVGENIKLVLFPGFNLAFGLSLLALVSGAGLYALPALRQRWADIPLPSASGIYERILAAVDSVGDLALQTQNGKLRHYLVIILGVVALLIALPGFSYLSDLPVLVGITQSADLLEIVLLTLAISAAVASVLFRDHLIAVLALGLMGYAVGGVFLLEPATDVALVQYLVETLGTVMLIMMVSRISQQQRDHMQKIAWKTTNGSVWRDLGIAALIGALVGSFALATVNSRPERTSIASWHLENAEPQTGATDVVAAIITDFRGNDTLIEIGVFSVAAIGVLTLLSTFWHPTRITGLRDLAVWRKPSRNPDDPVVLAPEDLCMCNPLTRVVARLVLPFAFLIALTHVLYGSTAPGDGFTAGMIAGLAIALWYVVFGYAETRQRLPWLHPGRLIGLGLALALLNAIVPLALGGEFLGFWRYEGITLPADLKLSSTLFFEMAIFLTVFGGTATIMEAITHPREVETL